MNLTVDPAGLRADASALLVSATPGRPAPACQAAASDWVSTHLAASLTTWAQSLHLLTEHAGQLRAAGGQALKGTAAYLSRTDADNASAIGRVMDGGSPALPAPSPPPPGGIPEVALPSLPVPPSLTPPAPMQAEQIAALVHSGPGPQGLRAFAAHVRGTVGPTVLHTAARVRTAGTSVARNWRDGRQHAAAHITDHAEWLESSLHPQVLALAGAADAAAEHTDTLIQATPHPREFTDLNQRLKVALAHYNATGGANAAQVATLSGELTRKRAAAMAAFQAFATAAPPTITAQTPGPAPPIVQNPGGAAGQLQPATPTEPATTHDQHPAGYGHDGPGFSDPDNPDRINPAAYGSAAPQPTPGLASPPTAAGAAPSPVNTLATVAGVIMGAGTGAVGQVTHGLGAGSPLSALSSLSSLPHMGSGSPQMPESSGNPDSSPDSPEDGDFGSGGTTPASGAGDGAGGGGGGGAPMSSSSPAVGAPTGSTVSVGGPATGSTTPNGAGPGSGMGMMPPMMGGTGRKNDEARKSEERRRVVVRPKANTEAVFGEVRREPIRRAEKKT